MHTISNHQYDGKKPVRPVPTSKPDIQVVGLQVYATSLCLTSSETY